MLRSMSVTTRRGRTASGHDLTSLISFAAKRKTYLHGAVRCLRHHMVRRMDTIEHWDSPSAAARSSAQPFGRAAGKPACTNGFAGTLASVLRFDRQGLADLSAGRRDH